MTDLAPRPLNASLHDTLDAAQAHLAQQVTAWRGELTTEASHLGRTAAVFLTGVGTAVLGHLLVVAAVVAFIASAPTLAWAFAFVGIPHLLLGTTVAIRVRGPVRPIPFPPE